jgi:CRISPR-associated protein Cas1
MSHTAVDLVPVRALNQVSYCKRLYYLEYVESVMPTNEYVEDGIFQHRRVNDPALANRTRKDGEALHTWSVSLSSERLGITGKLDLVEERGGATLPIEYKRSSAPPAADGRPGFYENDAIQLCAQGLLLEEELSVPVSRGVLFYIGSKTRVEVALDDALRARTLEAIANARSLSAQAAPPEPLPPELRHRCFGCSLATVCLPEETLYSIRSSFGAGLPTPPSTSGPVLSTPRSDGGPSVAAMARSGDLRRGEEPFPLRRVIPQSDDGAVLYLHEPGSHVGKRSEHLIVHLHGAEVNRVPLASIRQVVLCGNVQVSTQALHTLAFAEVPVAYLTPYGRFVATFQPAPAKNVSLRADQYRIFSDPVRALDLAKQVVRAKVVNQRTLLMRSLRSARAESCGVDPEALPAPVRGSDEPAARDMADLLPRIDRAEDPATLLGLEGQAASLYFGVFGRMLKAPGPGRPFDFRTRNRRPPRDPVNALLSFAYAILVKDCFAAACTVGFDPYFGFFHAGRHGRPSLALDLMEEFRAVIADSVVLTLINNGVLTDRDFLAWRDACQLTDAGRTRFFETYEQRKATVVTHPLYGYKMSYGRMLEVQARMLAAYVRGDVPSYTGFTVR